MNTETLSLLRAAVAKIDALCADGYPLEQACAEADATPRSYRRWKELLAFTLIEGADSADENFLSVLPELEARHGRVKFSSGETLFRLGDYADHMYVVARGTVYVPELDAIVEAGEIVGEIGVFSENRRRMASAVCLDACELIRIERECALELSCRKPTIGLEMTRIIADRLARNAERSRIATAQSYPAGMD